MSEPHCPTEPPLDAIELIDHRTVAWSNVRHTQYWMHKRFHYTYPGPIRELRQRLMVLPPEQYGDQRLLEHRVRIIGARGTQTADSDEFGNQLLLFHVPYVRREITFEVTLKVERAGFPNILPQLTAEQAELFLAPTSLTEPDPPIDAVARQLAAEHRDPAVLAEAINSWVAKAMRYGHGATSVKTTAAEALAIGEGLCQDYSHIMLALCRAAGLPARYVSGHLLGEGGSHAWVEVLLPGENGGYVAVPFDPTNHRRGTLSYITIAVGRDYRDVSPTSGTYVAPYQGRLTASKRAGITQVEYIPA